MQINGTDVLSFYMDLSPELARAQFAVIVLLHEHRNKQFSFNQRLNPLVVIANDKPFTWIPDNSNQEDPFIVFKKTWRVSQQLLNILSINSGLHGWIRYAIGSALS